MEYTKNVVLIHDLDGPNDDIANILIRYHEVVNLSWDTTDPPDFSDSLLIVLDVDLRNRQIVEHLRNVLLKAASVAVPRVFVLNEFERRAVLQIHTLGSQDFVTRPLNENDILPLFRNLINGSVEDQWKNLNRVQQSALKVSLKVFDDMMTKAFSGEPLPAEAIRESSKAIIKATAHGDVAAWTEAIRDHHNYTFRHSMMVCGYLVSFAYLIGIRGSDLQTLTMGAILHDIGKVFTPIEILDKPGRLNEEEWEIMRRHPVDSRQIFAQGGEWDPNIVDLAVHHHEKLDGTGYPDGLAGNEISDIVRLISIADVFSALVDKRAYKSARDGKESFELMLTMDGQLDIPLVRAFEPIAFSNSHKILSA